MSEIKKMDLSGYDSSDSEKKGSLNVPYSIVEYEDAIKKNNWGGGYVAGLGYIKPLLQMEKDDDGYYNVYEGIGGLVYDFEPVECSSKNYKIKCYCHVNYCVDQYGNVSLSPRPIVFIDVEGLINRVPNGFFDKEYGVENCSEKKFAQVESNHPIDRIYFNVDVYTHGLCENKPSADIDIQVHGEFLHTMSGSDWLTCDMQVNEYPELK